MVVYDLCARGVVGSGLCCMPLCSWPATSPRHRREAVKSQLRGSERIGWNQSAPDGGDSSFRYVIYVDGGTRSDLMDVSCVQAGDPVELFRAASDDVARVAHDRSSPPSRVTEDLKATARLPCRSMWGRRVPPRPQSKARAQPQRTADRPKPAAAPSSWATRPAGRDQRRRPTASGADLRRRCRTDRHVVSARWPASYCGARGARSDRQRGPIASSAGALEG